MRWKEKGWPKDRIVWRFLLWPKTLDGETRWWEWAKVHQTYFAGEAGVGWGSLHWADRSAVGDMQLDELGCYSVAQPVVPPTA